MKARLAVAALGAVLAASCGGGDDGPDARDFAGTWDVQLVVGAVDADPGADPASFPGDTSFRETWVFEGCDEERCTLRRPEGGLLLGDLDEVAFEFVDSGRLDDTPRFTGEATAEAVARVDAEPPPGEEDQHDDEAEGGGDAACFGTAAYRWGVRLEVDVVDGVLSGTVLRIPEELRLTEADTECFGIDLTLGLSGIPSEGSGDGSGDAAPG